MNRNKNNIWKNNKNNEENLELIPKHNKSNSEASIYFNHTTKGIFSFTARAVESIGNKRQFFSNKKTKNFL